MDLFQWSTHRIAEECRREALRSVAEEMPELRARVYAAIRDHGPITDEGIQGLLGMPPNTQRPRRVELLDRGLIVGVGKAPTRSGRSATLWSVAP